jgi:sRNA-binding protein
MPQTLPFWDQIRAARAMLDIHHPGLFSLEKPVPLACGIRLELADAHPKIPPPVLRKLLWWLTQRRAYLSACTAGAPRMGLAGPVGQVTEHQAAFSKSLFNKREAQAKAQAKAA